MWLDRVRAVSPLLRLGKTEVIQQAVVIAPVLAHLYPALQVHAGAQQFLAIHAGGGGNLFQHLAALANDHALMALALTVDVHVKRLREKIKDHETWSIATVWGIGYKFEVKG